MTIKEIRKLMDPEKITDVEIMKKVIGKGKVEQKIFLIDNKNLPQELLEELYSDKSPNVRYAAESTKKIPTRLMMKNVNGIGKYSTNMTHSILLERDDLTDNDLEQIYEASETKPTTALSIIENHSCSKDFEARLRDENAQFFEELGI